MLEVEVLCVGISVALSSRKSEITALAADQRVQQDPSFQKGVQR
jgi:hypothetical protein